MGQPVFVVYYFHEGSMGQWQEELSSLMPELKLVAPDSPDAGMAEVLIGWGPPEEMLAGLGGLKCVFSLGQGVDHVLWERSFPSGLELVRLVDPSMADAMAEWTLLAILERHRDREAYRAAQERREWIRLPARDAALSTVAVMGLGAIGGTIASRVSAMGFRTIGWSRSLKQIEGVEAFRGDSGFRTCLAEADYLVSVLPLTRDTVDLYGSSAFEMMKEGAVFINAGRGLQVVEDDLVAALDNGNLAAAVLDVVRVEPLPEGSPLWTHPKITIWPHVSGVTSAAGAAPQVVEAVKAVHAGKAPANIVDIERGY